tara:strand:+ start:3325 stop:3561 length:237 start_codon:yes stop_codon:yes gene_type:complete
MDKCYDKEGNVRPCNDIKGENSIQQAKNKMVHLYKKTKKVDIKKGPKLDKKKETKTNPEKYLYGGKSSYNHGGRTQHD